GFSKPKIAKLLGVHKCTIYNYLKTKKLHWVE
ncbi:MAG: helix-turn-helix domain-containing protein, partial [Alphaproteobacteria bacterium]|nr:helix-turn-helix domain-containing protein [Alphaproteobacteria bacterium]